MRRRASVLMVISALALSGCTTPSAPSAPSPPAADGGSTTAPSESPSNSPLETSIEYDIQPEGVSDAYITIKNASSTAVGDVVISCSYTDDQGDKQTIEETRPTPDVLAPGKTALRVIQGVGTEKDVSVNVESSELPSYYAGWSVDDGGWSGEAGTLKEVTLRNTGSLTMSVITVYCTLFDAGGRAVGAFYAPAWVDELAPGATVKVSLEPYIAEQFTYGSHEYSLSCAAE